MSFWYDHFYPWEQMCALYDSEDNVRLRQTQLTNDMVIHFEKSGFDYIDLLEEKQSDDILELPSPNEVANRFFREKRFPILAKLQKNAHVWILAYVTSGRFRTDKNKRVWYFDGTPRKLDDAFWFSAIKNNNSSKFWKPVECGLTILQEISERCNESYECIMHRFENCDSDNRNVKNCLINFRRLPEFVAFQKYRGNNHKNHFWTHIGVKRGGNKCLARPAKSVPHRIQSVHFYLQNYHYFMGNMRNVV